MDKKVQEIINDVLSDLETYKSNVKKFKASISTGDSGQINLVLSTAEYCLTNSSVKPIAMLNALRLLKESVDTKQAEIIKRLNQNKKILEAMFELAKFDSSSQNDDRGSLYYGEKADQQQQIIGNSLIRLSLECFLFWSYLYQNDLENPDNISAYLQYYESLVELGVKFPEKINYFKQALKEMQQQTPVPSQEGIDQQQQQQYSDQNVDQQNPQEQIEESISKLNNMLLQIEMGISNLKNDSSIDLQDLDRQFGVIDEFVDSSFQYLQMINSQYQNLEGKYKQYLTNLQTKAMAVQKCYKPYKQRKTDFIKFRNAYLEATNKELLQIILEEEEQEKKGSQSSSINIFQPGKSKQQNQNLEIEEIDDIDYGDSKGSSHKKKSNISSSGFNGEDQFSSSSFNNNNKKSKLSKDESPRLYYYSQSGEKQNTRQQSEERKSSTRYDDSNEDGSFINKKEELKDVTRNTYQSENINKQNVGNNINPRDSFGHYSSRGQNTFTNKNEDSLQPAKFGGTPSNNSSRIVLNNNSSSNYSSTNNTAAFRFESNQQQIQKSFRENSDEISVLQRNVNEKQIEIERLMNLLNAKDKERELVEKEVKINKDEKEMHKRENDKYKISLEKLENQISVLQREKNLIIDEKEILNQKLDSAQGKITQLTDKTIQNSQQMTDYQLIASESTQLRQELNQLRNYHQEIIDSHEKRENEMMQRIRESEKEKAQKENENEREKLKLNEKIKDLTNQLHGLEEKNRILEENMEHTKRISIVVDEQKQSESKKTQNMAQELQSKKVLIEKYEADNERLTKQIVLLKDDMKRQNEYLSELEQQLNNSSVDKDQLQNKIQDLLQQLSEERAKVASQHLLEFESTNADQKIQNERLEFNLKLEKLELENLKLQKEVTAKKEYIDTLNQNSTQLNELIQDLKDQSKSSNLKLEQQAVKIRELSNQSQQQQKSARSMSTDRQLNLEELSLLKSQIQDLQNERNVLKKEIEDSRNSKLTYRSFNNSSTGEVKAQQTEIEERLQSQQTQIDHLNKIIVSLQTEGTRPKSKRDHLEIQTLDTQNINNFDNTYKSTQYSNYTGNNDMVRIDTKTTPTSRPPIYVRDSISEDQSTQAISYQSRNNKLNITQNLQPMVLKLSNLTSNSNDQLNQLQSGKSNSKLMQDFFGTQGSLGQSNQIDTSFSNTKNDFNISGQVQPQKVLHSEPSSQTPHTKQFSLDQMIAQTSLPQSVKNSRGLNTIEEESSNTYRKRPTIRSKSNMNNYSNSSNFLNLSDYLRSKTPIQSGQSTSSHSHYFSNTIALFNQNSMSNNNNLQSQNGISHSRSRQDSRNNSRCDSRVSSDFLNLSAEQRDSQDNTLYLDIENNDYHLSTHNNTSFNVNPQNAGHHVNNVITPNNNLTNTPSGTRATFGRGQRSYSHNSSKQNLLNINNSGMNLSIQPSHQISNLNDTENFATTTTNLQQSSITPSERQKCDFFFQQLIYPFQKPDDYYNSKNKPNNIKGLAIKFNNQMCINYQKQFEKITNGSIYAKDSKGENLFDRFRKACLLEKGVIYSNNYIKVGTLTTHHYSQTKKHFLKITIHFLNISKYDIEQLSYINSNNEEMSIKMNPSVVKCDIPSEHKVKVDILLQINKTPLFLPEGSLLINLKEVDQQVQILLPATINKFMTYKEISLTQLKSKWQYIQQKFIFKSPEFEYSNTILKNSFSVSKFFPNLVELTPFEKDEHVAGISDYKVGGVAQFLQKENSEYIYRFIFKPLQRMQIQFAPTNQNNIDETDTNVADYFINTIYFLFKA